MAQEDFGAHVLRSPTEGERLQPGVDALLREPEIRYSDVSVAVKKNVLGFEVAIDYPLLVEELQGKDDLGRVEARSLKLKSMFGLEHLKQVASLQEIQDETELGTRLECVVELNDEGAVRVRQYISFRLRVDYLPGLLNELLIEYLHSVVLP